MSVRGTTISQLVRFGYRLYPFARGKNFLRRVASGRIKGLVVSNDTCGNTLLLDLGNFIDVALFLDGVYEPEGIAWLAEWCVCRKCELFVDVGANLGVYSLSLAGLPCMRKVYAFEPDPRNFAQLMGNIFLCKNAQKIEAQQVALSSVSGEASLFLARRTTALEHGKLNTGTSSLGFAEARHEKDVAVRVATRTLDELFDMRSSTAAVKIDVEGHECSVLRGARRFLVENQCAVLLEALGRQVTEIESLMREMGYKEDRSVRMEGYKGYLRS